MSPDERFAQTLSAWLGEEAAHRVPDHLAEVLVQTAATRQRPWWSSLERLLPMTTTTGGRVLARPPVFWFAMLAMLLLALVGATLLIGALRDPTPLGLPSNGRIVVADGTTLVSYAADGTDRQTLLELTSGAAALSVSPDGTKVAYVVQAMPPEIHIVSMADGAPTEIRILEADVLADDPVGWSPDGTLLVVAGATGGRDRLFVAAADGSSVQTPIDDDLDPDLEIWQPAFSPDGAWIAFATRSKRTDFGSLYVTHPDGTELRALTTPSVKTGEGGGPLWSPAEDAHRIAYLTFANDGLVTRMYDLDTDTDHELGPGFWASWSPDGAQLATCCATVVDIDDAIAGVAEPRIVFGEFPDGCPAAAEAWTGRAICSAVVWSPDGEWLIGADIAGRDLLITRADGTGQARRLGMTSGSTVMGFKLPVAWQPIWP